MLVMGKTLQEIIIRRDTLTFLLQNLGFVINLKKSVTHTVKQMEFLGLAIDTEEVTLAPSEKKIKHVSQKCQGILTQPKTSKPAVISCPSHFTSTNAVGISSTGTNVSSTEKGVL